MAKHISILLMVALGFLFIPSMNTYVSGNTAMEMSCCDMEMTDDCCEGTHSDTEHHDEPCHGDCGNASCACASANSAASFLVITTPASELTVADRLSLSHAEAYLPSVLLSIWAPPKIS